jgi:PKHD-type hydroxylase
MFELNYWYWSGVLSNELCDAIISEGDKLIFGDGKVGSTGNSLYNNLTRDTNISFFETGHWIEGICLHYANLANNNSKWNIDIRYPQPVQYSRYFPDQHYISHRDDTVNPNNTEMRKLSVVLQISDSNNYEGGDFVIEKNNEMQTIPEFKPRGSVIVFPSVVTHGILPVTKGVRHSVVCWIVGPNYR